MLPALHFRSLFSARLPHLGIVPVVASLAQRREVQKACRFRSMVKNMRRGQNHFPTRHRVRLAVLCPAPLAAVPRPEETHKTASELPVSRVTRFVFWSYWHDSSNPAFNPTALKCGGLIPR